MLRRDVAAGDGHEARQAGLRRQHVVVTGVERALRGAIPEREEVPRPVVEEREVHLFHETVGLRGDRGQSAPDLRRPDVAAVAFDTGLQRQRPLQGRAVRGRVLVAEGPNDVDQSLGMDREGRQAFGPWLRLVGNARQQRARLA